MWVGETGLGERNAAHLLDDDWVLCDLVISAVDSNTNSRVLIDEVELVIVEKTHGFIDI